MHALITKHLYRSVALSVSSGHSLASGHVGTANEPNGDAEVEQSGEAEAEADVELKPGIDGVFHRGIHRKSRHEQKRRLVLPDRVLQVVSGQTTVGDVTNTGTVGFVSGPRAPRVPVKRVPFLSRKGDV